MFKPCKKKNSNHIWLHWTEVYESSHCLKLFWNSEEALVLRKQKWTKLIITRKRRDNKLALQRTQLLKMHFFLLCGSWLSRHLLYYQTTVPLLISGLISASPKRNKGNLSWLMLLIISSIEKWPNQLSGTQWVLQKDNSSDGTEYLQRN